MPVSLELLRSFASLKALRSDGLLQLARQAQKTQHPGGSLLYRAGEYSQHAHFLIHGSVQIEDSSGRPLRTLRAVGPLDGLEYESPRRHSARCLSEVVCVRLDESLLEITLSWDRGGGIDVGEIQAGCGADDNAGHDWMLSLLRARSMHDLPAHHLQNLFFAMQPIEVSAGTLIVEEGSAGDFFYVIERGQCVVLREQDGVGSPLAQFSVGDCFGEEALITGAVRNATVIASTDCRLRRLDRASFLRLLSDPLTPTMRYAEAAVLVGEGRARWLDVRPATESQTPAPSDSLHMSIYWLRARAAELDPATRYVCVCNNGFRSRIATFLLRQRGLDAVALIGGLESLAATA